MTGLFNFFGVLGAACFALCSLPQIAKCVKEGHASGVSWGFVFMGIGGNVFSAAYLIHADLLAGLTHWPIYTNYAVAFILCLGLLWLKVRDWLRHIPQREIRKIRIEK